MIILLLLSAVLQGCCFNQSTEGISCRFKGKPLVLNSGLRKSTLVFGHRPGMSNAELDTMSNWFSPDRNYVEIIRQDDPFQPQIGIALGFEFDERNGDYPYTPAYAKIQIKDFRWGGVEFSVIDTFNYTGVTNDVSDDLSIQVEGYRDDTIFGRFSGLLLSGAGPMAPLDSGYFRAFVYRME